MAPIKTNNSVFIMVVHDDYFSEMPQRVASYCKEKGIFYH